jgi:hypothetical protein
MIIRVLGFINLRSLCVTPPYVPFKTMKHSLPQKPSSFVYSKLQTFLSKCKTQVCKFTSIYIILLFISSTNKILSRTPPTKFYTDPQSLIPHSWGHMHIGIKNFSDFRGVILLNISSGDWDSTPLPNMFLQRNI